jgi:hypothetical protein
VEGFDRRKFLKGSSVAAGLAGAMTIVPGAIPAFAKSAGNISSQAGRNLGAGAVADGYSTSDPVVLHVRDATRGQIDMFIGTKHVVVNDRALAGRIMSAAG